jgi:monoamine oxidase
MGSRRSGLNRRALLAAGSAFAVAGRAAAAADLDVVVIGAGAAGIAAAHALRAAGRRAIVLEARGRVGGRAFTDASLGPAYDAGATFIHWAERNPWVAIARGVGVATAAESRGGGFQVFADGRPMAEPERRRRRDAFRRIESRLETADLDARDRSIAELIGDLGPDLAPVAASGLLLSIGEEAGRISARDYRRLWSGDDLVVPSGYGDLVARSAAGLDIRLGEPVEAVRWDGPGVAVTSPSGTLRAGACIVTVPVGVLKAGTIRFVPELPAATRDALAGLHMGALTKIALKLEGDRFGIAPGTNLLEAAAPERLLNLVMFPGGKDLVIGACGGDYARGLCEAGLGEARAQVVDLLARMLGSDIRKTVREASFPAWWTDPFARGAYSVCDPGHETARDALARPIGERLFIAGEATAGGGAMTVGGATLAGRAAAAAVLARKA